MNYKKVKFRIDLKHCELVTRDGQNVQYCGYNLDAISNHKVTGWLNQVNLHWDENGNFTNTEHDFDLFALVEQECGFINIHEDRMGKWADERIYDYYSIAEENGKLSATYVKTIQIEL